MRLPYISIQGWLFYHLQGSNCRQNQTCSGELRRQAVLSRFRVFPVVQFVNDFLIIQVPAITYVALLLGAQEETQLKSKHSSLTPELRRMSSVRTADAEAYGGGSGQGESVCMWWLHSETRKILRNGCARDHSTVAGA